jgi:AcrR family transcriptional regulator
MVQKSRTPDPPGKRGRPRAYDPETALGQARDAFWDAGFAATSLDDLSLATGMNRPSLYGAFGDKRQLYLETIGRYRAFARAAMAETLAPGRPLAAALSMLYGRAIQLYLAGDNGQRGCFLIGTATTEAVRDAETRTALAEGLAEIDRAFETRFRRAIEDGEIAGDADPSALGRLASAILHTLALRARAGESEAVLSRIAEDGVALLQGSTPRRGRRSPPRPRSTR